MSVMLAMDKMMYTNWEYLHGGVDRCAKHELTAGGGAQTSHGTDVSGERSYVIVALNIHDLNILIKCSYKTHQTRLNATHTQTVALSHIHTWLLTDLQ